MSVVETWVLAFDASCGTCREVSEVVLNACDGRLEVLPLSRPDVEEWRRRALGEDPEWTPTLLRVSEGNVTAWTGAGMALPLTRRLGVKASVRVLQALGKLRDDVRNPLADSDGGTARRRFLQLGAGLAVAGGIVLAGRTPAFADDRCVAAREWVQANLDRLPTTYADLTRYQMDYRRAIFSELTPDVQSALWVEHLNLYRAGHPTMTPEQDALMDRFIEVARDTTTFSATEPSAAVSELRDLAIEAFGKDEAAAILANLGPALSTGIASDVTPNAACTCSYFSDYCASGRYCTKRYKTCSDTSSGCGSYWVYACNGLCCSSSTNCI
ncbi:bacteriocin fulvocin C-related protein [Stackebrandtia soli]|uniref:bacteriocin fulvocin C-related protein n=1 Tax=Stackebrandtia soli TaxID=1892856 RepID=UPI0039E83301